MSAACGQLDHRKGNWVWMNTKGTQLQFEGDDDIKQTIKSLGNDEEKKFLGVFNRLEGENVKHIEKTKRQG